MKNSFLNSIKNSIKHWYIPLLVGLLFVIVSIVVFTSPITSLMTLSLLFALSFLFGGLSEIVFAIANRSRMDNWGWSLAFGILTFIIGTSLVMHPGLSISVLAFYIGFLLLFRSISSISYAMDLKKYGSKNWGGLLVFGILGAIFSFLLIWNPVFAGMSVVVLVALSFLFAGLFSILLSFQLRKIHKSSKNISAKLRARYDDIMEEIRDEWDD
ncbi:HdeD family acid-resistance protein [Aequorivita marina]|uniref:HdeD family acid-resistance protein n=1 Tax=Aequorivita marina TaxID=3073654 RepID=UPI002875FDEB|nr:HdeD family acid-resistance protein [Aequorivita sp. S2608]MDS1299142.1 HdeD family acid-resistance protein [Aequorivita sp. S2608]